MAKQKVLLDTDIGSDVDDAVCLAYLLAQPECELLGITTVTGEAGRRAELADAVCQVAGREVPIFPGAEQALIIPQKQPHAPQAAALESWPHRRFTAGRAMEAIQFLSATIRAHPGEVHLLPIGPLTNIALLFALDPEIPGLLRSLTLMGGNYIPGGGREWNTSGDPHATAMVFAAAANRLCSVGLNVTRHVRLSDVEVRQRFTAPLLRPVLDFAEIWFQQRPELVFHDPLAAAVLFDEGLCRFESGRVEVALSDPDSLGTTHWMPGGPGSPHRIAVQVDAARFFEHFFEVLNR